MLVPNIDWKTLTYFAPLRGAWCQQLHLTSQVISRCCRALVRACWKENWQVCIYHKCNPRYFLDLAFLLIHIPTLVMQFHYTSGCSTCCDLVDILQTSQQAMVWGSWRCHHLKHWLERSPIQFFIDLVSVEVYGHQTEDVNIHLLWFSHSADNMWKTEIEVKVIKWQTLFLFWFSSLKPCSPLKQFILKLTNDVQVQKTVIWQITAAT